MEHEKILITGDFEIPQHLATSDVIHMRVPQNNDQIIKHLQDVSHYVVGGPEYVDEVMMMAAPNLKHVVVMGTGTNSFIDLDAAKKRNIHVDNTPGINADAVAEFALGAIIFNTANSFHSREGLLQGAWYQKPHRTLSEMRIGIIGIGDIGSRLASKIRAISPHSDLQYFARTQKPEIEKDLGLEYRIPQDMAQECDVMIMSVTYNKDSHEMINRTLLSGAKNGIMLFNFSNPKIIEPTALKDALSSGKVGFAYYDGYYDEWIYNQGQDQDKYGLLSLGADKFIATSHIAAQANGVLEQILAQAFKKISLYKEGKRQPYILHMPSH